MTRTIPLLLLGLAAACSESPDLMGPEPAPADPIVQTLVAGDPILDAIERITPALDDRAFAGELVSALRNAEADPSTVERLLVRLSSNADYGADADAIRLALVRR
jgi:hypothetical protein